MDGTMRVLHLKQIRRRKPMFRKSLVKGILLLCCAYVPVSMSEMSSVYPIFQEVSADELIPSFKSQGGSEFEPGTFKMRLKVGERGQILRPQNSPLKDMRYSFDMQVEDPSIITFDEQGNWTALKAGSTKIYPSFPSGDSDQAKKFADELKAYPVELSINDIAVAWEVTVEDSDVEASKPMHRLYNPNNKEHFYTSNLQEKDALVQMGWGQYEGVAWQAPEKGEAVYRLYNPILKDHHYTKDLNEITVLTEKHFWKYEGLAWYSGGGRPVYRLFHQGLTSGSHHYTMDEHEVAVLQQRGWIYEGIAWYGNPAFVFESSQG